MSDISVEIAESPIALSLGSNSVSVSMPETPISIDISSGPIAVEIADNTIAVMISGGSSSGADPSFPITAGENLAARDLIYFQSDALAYKADNGSAASEAVAIVKEAVAMGDAGSAYPAGTIVTGFTGLTPGARYFLTTAGGFDSVMPQPGASLVVIQQVCTSVSATDILFDPKTIVVCPII